MRQGTLYLSLVTLLFAFLLIGLGAVCGLVPFIPSLQLGLIKLLNNPLPWLPIMGALGIVSGFLVLLGANFFCRKTYMQLRMGDLHVDVDPALLTRYLEHYWRQIFPEGAIRSEVEIQRGQIAIDAELPNISVDEQRRILQRAELDLVELFHTVLRYERDFVLNVSFG